MAPAGIGADLEGIHAVRAGIEAGRVTHVIAERNRATGVDVAAIIELARSNGIGVELVDDVRPLAATTTPQGIVARARPIVPLTLKQAVAGVDAPALVVLDHIEDPRNVGAIARTAVASGMSGLVVPKRRSAPLGATAFKAAVGTLELIPIIEVSSVADAVAQLRRLQVWTVGLDGSAEQSLFGLEILSQPVALCVGAEGAGLSHLVSQRCDVVASIPMAGPAESLNASVAAAIGCFEVARMRGWVS